MGKTEGVLFVYRLLGMGEFVFTFIRFRTGIVFREDTVEWIGYGLFFYGVGVRYGCIFGRLVFDDLGRGLFVCNFWVRVVRTIRRVWF